MQGLPVEQKLPMVLPYLQKAGLAADPPSDDVRMRLARILEAAGDRIKVAGDILDYRELFLPDDQFPFDEKAFEELRGKAEDARIAAERLLSQKEALEAQLRVSKDMLKLVHGELSQMREIKMNK